MIASPDVTTDMQGKSTATHKAKQGRTIDWGQPNATSLKTRCGPFEFNAQQKQLCDRMQGPAPCYSPD
jgi:hypothetical protein